MIFLSKLSVPCFPSKVSVFFVVTMLFDEQLLKLHALKDQYMP